MLGSTQGKQRQEGGGRERARARASTGRQTKRDRRGAYIDDATGGDLSDLVPLGGLTRGRQAHEHEVLDDAGRAPVAAIEGVGEDEARFEDDTGAEAEADEDDGPRPMRTLEEHVGQ